MLSQIEKLVAKYNEIFESTGKLKTSIPSDVIFRETKALQPALPKPAQSSAPSVAEWASFQDELVIFFTIKDNPNLKKISTEIISKLRAIDFSSPTNKALRLRIIKTIMLLGKISPPENEKNDYYCWIQTMLSTPFKDIIGNDAFDLEKIEPFFNLVKDINQEEIDTIKKDVNTMIDRIINQYQENVTELNEKLEEIFQSLAKIVGMNRHHLSYTKPRIKDLILIITHGEELIRLVNSVNSETDHALEIPTLPELAEGFSSPRYNKAIQKLNEELIKEIPDMRSFNPFQHAAEQFFLQNGKVF